MHIMLLTTTGVAVFVSTTARIWTGIRTGPDAAHTQAQSMSQQQFSFAFVVELVAAVCLPHLPPFHEACWHF